MPASPTDGLPEVGVVVADALAARRDELARGLRGAGFQVFATGTVEAAAEIAGRESPMAVLVDPGLLLTATNPVGEMLEKRSDRPIRLIVLVDRPDRLQEDSIRHHGAALLPSPREDMAALIRYLHELSALELGSEATTGRTPVGSPAGAARLLPEPRPAASEMNGTVIAWEHTDSHEGPAVLVVDDSATSRQLMVRTLARRAYRIFSCPGAGQAMRFLEVNRDVALVVSDLYMPEVNGLQLKDQLDRHGRSIPFVVVTATPSSENVELARKMGAKAVFSKPIVDPLDFHSWLERILDEASTEPGYPPR